MRKIPMPTVVLLLITMVQLACPTEGSIRREVRATAAAELAIAQTQTAEAQVTLGIKTPTPDCLLGIYGPGCAIETTPRPPTATPTLPPTPTRVSGMRTVITKGGESTWHDYYQDPDDSRKLGVISGGQSLVVVNEMHNGRFLQVLLSGTMEVTDLGFLDTIPDKLLGKMGETTCIDHTWGHARDKRMCHAHFWCGEDVCATIPKDFEYVIDSESASERRVQVRLITLVWLENDSVK